MTHYSPATSEAERITTKLRNDSRDGLEALGNATRFITHDLPSIVEQMQRLWREHRDPQALRYLERFEHAAREIGAAITATGEVFVDDGTLSPSQRDFRLAQALGRTSRPEVYSTAPDNFFDDPTTVD